MIFLGMMVLIAYLAYSNFLDEPAPQSADEPAPLDSFEGIEGIKGMHEAWAAMLIFLVLFCCTCTCACKKRDEDGRCWTISSCVIFLGMMVLIAYLAYSNFLDEPAPQSADAQRCVSSSSSSWCDDSENSRDEVSTIGRRRMLESSEMQVCPGPFEGLNFTGLEGMDVAWAAMFILPVLFCLCCICGWKTRDDDGKVFTIFSLVIFLGMIPLVAFLTISNVPGLTDDAPETSEAEPEWTLDRFLQDLEGERWVWAALPICIILGMLLTCGHDKFHGVLGVSSVICLVPGIALFIFYGVRGGIYTL